MLVDSAVWVRYFRGERRAEVELLTGALRQSKAIWLAPPILQEVLQGADRLDCFNRWDRVLGNLPMLLPHDLRAITRAAARLYAQCRWKGVTPRSANDCLIAMYAIEHEVPLLHCERDFDHIARVDPRLKVVAVT
ncbi:MAG: PIN domain nuclease [Betaproteobacteria bacterium]|nr:PIN domain nuclease [Betaproteobacteria bacterium]